MDYYTVKEYPLESSAGGRSVYSVQAPGDVSFSAYFRIREHAEDLSFALNEARARRLTPPCLVPFGGKLE